MVVYEGNNLHLRRQHPHKLLRQQLKRIRRKISCCKKDSVKKRQSYYLYHREEQRQLSTDEAIREL
jgi:hypothetical protein